MLNGLSILIIGSSHLAMPGYLITSLHDRLVKQGAQVHSIGVCGVTPSGWVTPTNGNCGGAERSQNGPVKITLGRAAATRPLAQLVEAERPNVVVVVMGDTIAGYDEPYFPKQWAARQVGTLTTTLESLAVRCVWVGPAWGASAGRYGKTDERVKLVSDYLTLNVKPCTYINSLKMSRPGEWATEDGQHFTHASYKLWGEAIARELEKVLKQSTVQQ